MENWNSIMQYAVGLEFYASQSSSEVSAIAVAFANTTLCRAAYGLLKKENAEKKLIAHISRGTVTLKLSIVDNEGTEVLNGDLNYDEDYLNEFIRVYPPGQSVALFFGAFHTSEFYIINPEKDAGKFQPFLIQEYRFNS